MNKSIVGAVLATLIAAGGSVRTQTGPPTELFFSEYIEGSSFNKALEIYNGTGAAVDLAAGGYVIQMYFNGSTSSGLTITLSGSIAAGDVFVATNQLAADAIKLQADLITDSTSWYNGDDAVVLRRGGTSGPVVDVLGQIGTDPGIEWGTGLTSTADNTLRRKSSICGGDTNGADAFDPALQWDGFANDTFGGLGTHAVSCQTTEDTAPSVISTNPSNGAGNVPLRAMLTVTFSEPVTPAGAWYTLVCGSSGAHAASVSGGPTAFTLTPETPFLIGESCTLTVVAAQVSDQDTADPPDTMTADVGVTFTTVATDPCVAPFTPIHAIQGSGATAAVTGAVTTQGVVVGDYEGPGSNFIRGFFIQGPADGNSLTSDGIFVFNGNNNSVSLGQLVRVIGSAGEFEGQTQLSSVTAIHPCGTGTVAPVDVQLPFAPAIAGVDDAERFEGMLVRLPQTLFVTEHFQLGRFGQVLLSANGRLPQPTHVTTPGAAALAVQAANDLNQIILDDGQNDQNPDPIVFGRGGQPLTAANTLRGGDTASGIVGVMTWSWAGNSASPNAWRVRPIRALGGTVSLTAANPRPESGPDVGGSLTVAGMNLLNYFNTFGSACNNGVGGSLTDCRGADDAFEFGRQWPKTVQAILATGAEVVGIVEIENDGYGPTSAIADLVGKLNAATAPGSFAYINADLETGQLNALGTDAIKVGLIYKPSAVMPIGATAALNTVAFVNGGDGGPRSRPALAQAFQTPSGGRFVAVVNHLKSKGSACDAPDANDGQGNCNGVRTMAAEELASWLATDPTRVGEAGILVLGDLNSYAQEDPIVALRTAGFTNLVEDLTGPTAYSFVFDGQWGYLDYALSNGVLRSQVTGVEEFHINADEPSVLDYNDDFKSAGQLTSLYAPDQFRVADHDPIVVGLELAPALSGHVTGGGWITAQPGDYTPAPTRGGRVAFELAARYEPGTVAPSGGVSVAFDGAAFSFLGASGQWLTVSGGHAILQGAGTIGGQPGFSYRVTVVDGSVAGGSDLIRIRIWSTSSGAVVFDNGGIEAIDRGSIVVH